MVDQVAHKEATGTWIADFIDHEEPLAGMVAAALWAHYAPALLKFVVPGTSITNAVTSALSSASAAVRGQVLTFSVPSGVISDVLAQLEKTQPGVLKAIESEVDRDIVAASKAMKIIP